MACVAKDRNGNACRNKGPFCKFHEYMKDYTPEMVEGCTLCKGCKKMKYMEKETCSECTLRGVETRKKVKAEVVLCAKEGCKYKKSENKYCGKHQLCQFIDETSALGLKTCVNAIRGCRSQIPIDGTSRCKDCLGIDRAKDHAKRNVVIIKTDTEKQCTTCCKMYPMESYKGKLGETKTCELCREANKRADEKRDADHINELARVNSAKPERKEVKRAWKESNYDKVATYWMEARARLIETDLEGYLKRCAEQAKKWREANPEKVKTSNKEQNENIDYHYVTYKRSAETKQLSFEIEKETFTELVKMQCHYCGIIKEKGFNGIDRLDSTKGYTMENIVSCCEMCNFMKGSMSESTFTKCVKHIATFHKKIEGELCPEIFKDVKMVTYSKSKISAISRNIYFDISKEQFNEKKKENCYLCGKQNTVTHMNGIDRVDSSIGYIESNIKSCCGTCNYMKNNYVLDSFLDKCIQIATNHTSKTNIIQMNHIVKGNKMTKEEKKEKERIRKQKQRDILREKYGDAEYKKIHAMKIAEQRKKQSK